MVPGGSPAWFVLLNDKNDWQSLLLEVSFPFSAPFYPELISSYLAFHPHALNAINAATQISKGDLILLGIYSTTLFVVPICIYVN